MGDPDISSDGRYIVFHSYSNNLVDDDNNSYYDIFLHDTETGETSLVSVNSDHDQGNCNSLYPAISDDGRFVVFQSWSDNLVNGDTNNKPDIFIRDLWVETTLKVSVSYGGTQGDSYAHSRPDISGNGLYVAFISDNSTMVPGDTNDQIDVFIRDWQNMTTTRVQVVFYWWAS